MDSSSTKESTSAAIDALHADGIRIVMLTGDNRITAEAVARQLGIDEVEAEVLPDQKAAIVMRLREQGRVVAMAGDGVNDAPVLGQSHVSVAMSSGADLAQTTADAILLGDRLSALVTARQIAIKTQLVIKQNLKWAFVYNLSVLPPAALGYIPPWLAAIGMSLSSLFVVLNALRLKRVN